MPHATVEIEVEPGPATDDGVDQVTYLLAANPGERARPLARAASGGELSRAMLAARVVLSEAPPTLVFDEVDAGIGGEAGAAVGRLLAGARARGTRCSASRTSRRWPRSPGRRSWWRRPWNGRRPCRGGRSERWHTRRWSTATSASPSCRACSRGSATPRHARRHAAELLEHRGRRGARSRTPVMGRSGAAGSSAALMARRCLRRASGPTRRSRSRARRAVDRRTKDMIPRLQAGEIAVINHRDLDRVAADGLIEAGVVAVVNAAPSISGRYPNGGPIRDRAGRDPAARRRRRRRCMDTRAARATSSASSDGELWRNGELLGAATVLDEAEHRGRRWRTRAHDDRHRARALRRQHARVHPEGGAAHVRAADPAAVAHASSPDATRSSSCAATTTAPTSPRCARTSASTGRCSSASTAAPTRCSSSASSPTSSSATSTRCRAKGLHCGAELVHHVHPDGRAPGRENLLEWGVEYHEFVAEGTSEDVAMLLAYESESQLIVAVGTHATMVEFLDKGRRGHGVDVPHPAAPRPDAGRRQGREPALRGPRPPPRHLPARRRRAASRCSSSASSPNPSTCSCAASGSRSRTSSAADDQLPVSRRLTDRDLPRPRARGGDRRRRHRPRRRRHAQQPARHASSRSPTASRARTTCSASANGQLDRRDRRRCSPTR